MRWPAAQTWPVIRILCRWPLLCLPASTFSSVVLPDPLGPRMQVRCPALAVPLTPLRICTADLVRPSVCHDDIAKASHCSSSEDSPKEEKLDLPMHHSSVSLMAARPAVARRTRGLHHRHDHRCPAPAGLLAPAPARGEATALESSESCLPKEPWHSRRVPPPRESTSEAASSSAMGSGARGALDSSSLLMTSKLPPGHARTTGLRT
mmetsp:Transcript_111575/g.315572  ORF Transcript_111575/g.315572 Transcript_111575/m.315572 type:complete len:207 (+) Transcript_111575:1674-2294(+)